jgi:hypothetical protein
MTFLKGFLRIASELGLGTQASQIAHFIPKKLSNQKLSIDLFSNTTSYKFGTPYSHKGRPFAFGSQQMPRLDHFTLAFVAASMILDENAFASYRTYLFNPDKHSDALLEIRPILSAMNPITIEYEVQGKDSKRIDWRLKYDDVELLFDVKNRSGYTTTYLLNILQNKSGYIVPNTDPQEIFNSTFNKFNSTTSENSLQGVWIHVGIKVSKNIIDQYFENKIDPQLMQFFIIAGWENEGLRTSVWVG